MSSDEVIGAGEFRTTRNPRLGHLQLISTGQVKDIHCSMIDNDAIFEGDIIIAGPLEPFGVGVTGQQYRWPNRTVIYDIDPALPKQDRVTDAIKHWEQHTVIRFARLQGEKDYVLFRPSNGCSSAVGKREGVQFINLGPLCTVGNTIHEIGHTVGLWHEQSRENRDYFVTIQWDNIIDNARHNFDQKITDGDDLGDYDYGSIMHYPANAFAKDPTRPTIVPLQQIPNGQQLGQRVGLSASDIAAVAQMYPGI